MDGGDRILVAAGLTAAVVVGAFVLWGPGGAPKVRRRRGQISGLQNLGRTCFLNTLLQALAACPSFIEWLKKYSKVVGNNSMITTLYTVIEVVNGTHAAARGTAVCPLGVLQALRAAGWVLPPDQHDAHELLHVLLSCLDEEATQINKKPGCLSDALELVAARSALASPASPPRAARPASAAPPDPDLHYEPPPLLRRGPSRSLCTLTGRRWTPPAAPPPPPAPTRGALAQRLTCAHCHYKSPVRYDKFDSISLPLASAGTGLVGSYTLAGLLRAFTSPEMVSGIRCSKCVEAAGDSRVDKHIRSVNFGKLPSCLCIHISRVEWTATGATKRAEHVVFSETLDLAPYSTQPLTQPDLSSLLSSGRLRAQLSTLNSAAAETRAQYSLSAVVVHVGGPRSGHFATYRRGNGFEAKRWWYTSDTLVHEVSLQEVLRCTAYMLFYERSKPNGIAAPHTNNEQHF